MTTPNTAPIITPTGPLSLTPPDVEAYHKRLQSLDYGQLIKEQAVLDRVYTNLEDLLPAGRTDLALNPHPLLQKRLLLNNELYRRASADPFVVSNWHRNKAMVEGAIAGSIVGGVVGHFGKSGSMAGAAFVGAVIGAIGAQSQLLTSVLEGMAARVAFM